MKRTIAETELVWYLMRESQISGQAANKIAAG